MRCSSAACSSTSDSTASNISAPPGDRRRRRPLRTEWVGAESKLLLAVALLEPGHAAAGVEDLLLARVERVAGRAHLGADDALGGGATGGERVAAGTADLGLHVLRMDVALHEVLSWPLGRSASRIVNQNRGSMVPDGTGYSEIGGADIPPYAGSKASMSSAIWAGV